MPRGVRSNSLVERRHGPIVAPTRDQGDRHVSGVRPSVRLGSGQLTCTWVLRSKQTFQPEKEEV